MQRTLCDWCLPEINNDARFRLMFMRLDNLAAEADMPIDLCKKHYDELYRLHCQRADIVQA